MNDQLAHRGPDDAGVWTDGAAGIALGHRRLAVIDLSSHAHQPMISHSQRFVLAFNGEIYNYEALRAQLNKSVESWRGHSDTEVLLAAVDHWGLEKTLQRANGMFAIALWDRMERALYLARDRFGEKPLYYAACGSTVLFASELKAFSAHPAWQPAIDVAALDLYMRCGYVQAPYSIFKGAAKLPAGCLVRIHTDGNRTPAIDPPRKYWCALETARRARTEPLSDIREAEEALGQLLRNSVRARAISDVPLGAFLSGGVDSSLVVAAMQQNAARPVRTFTIGYAESAQDESKYAEAVARFLKTEHVCHIVTPNTVSDAIRSIPSIYDEPFADSSQIPTYLVSKLARSEITVALTGDGGDELFGGYHRYFVGQNTWRRVQSIHPYIRKAIAATLQSLGPGQWDKLFGAVFKLTKTSSRGALSGDRLHRLAMTLNASTPAQMYEGLMTRVDDRTVLRAGGVRYQSIYNNPAYWLESFTEAEAMMLLDTVGILCDDFLVKVDRASMAVSLETRAPFLDPDLFEFAWRMPIHWKISDRDGKVLLRRVLAQWIPQTLFERPKQGFGIPIGEWLRGSLRDWAESLLSEKRLKENGLLDPAPIRKAWREHLIRSHDRHTYLWSVMVFQQWLTEQRSLRSARLAA